MKLASIQYRLETGWSDLPNLDSPTTMVLVFGGTGYADRGQVWKTLHEAYPNSMIIGCSSAGEISGEEIRDDSVTGVVARFDKTTLGRATAVVHNPADSYAAGIALARQLLTASHTNASTQTTASPLRMVLVFSDGLTVNGTELVKGLNSALPKDVLVSGGLAGDGDRFQRTWVLSGDQPETNRLVAIGLSGDAIRVAHGCKGGWDKFGPERRVTRSEGAVLFELDGKPALELYKQYLGDRASGLPATGLLFPLAIRSEADPANVLVRTILKVDEQAQSLTFAGDIPTGSFAQLMKANFDRLVQGAADAAEMGTAALPPAGLRNSPGDPANFQKDLATLAIAISCVGRRLVLGERAEEELEATVHMLPEGTCQVGFYSYGEISPYREAGSCELHNQTMTLTLLQEA